MFTSLRSRLWVSYALVISVALGVVSLVLLVYLVRNPLIYRQEAARLLVVQGMLLSDQGKWPAVQPADLQNYVDQLGDSLGTRILLFDSSRQRMADSGDQEFAALRMPKLPRERITNIIRDNEGIPWLYLLRQLDNDNWLMVTAPRPRFALLTFLRDDFLLPIVYAGAAALFLSLVLAYMISKWVGDPLQRVVAASQSMPKAETSLLKVEGPREVQALIMGFNSMFTRIKAAQQSQRQFVANVSHELKTPITIVQGFAQAILDGTVDTPESEKQAAQVIFDESGRMHRLVLDLLDLARLDAGTFDLKHESVDMNLLLIHVIELFTPQAGKANIEIAYSPGQLPPIYGDSDKLSQVFSNLLDNAIKFSSVGGKIHLAASNDTSKLRIDVSDDGVGIPADALPNIFDRFFQGDPSRPGGSNHSVGLGLAIVREIVLAHHGTITAQSKPGQGSTFTVCLPLALPDASTINRRRKP